MSEGIELRPRRGLSAYLVVFAVLVAAALGYFAWSKLSSPANSQVLRISVPPFVDTAFTQAGLAHGAFGSLTNRIRLVDTTWENQYDILAGGGLDISMSTVDEFVNKSRSLAAAGKPVVFILPAWKFRGLGFYSSKGVQSLSEYSGPAAKAEFLAQLQGKKVVLPEGSVFDQAFRAFLQGSGVKYEDLQVVNAPLDSALNSLSDPSVAIVAVGSQQRFEAERRGFKEAISPEALGLDVITGFVAPAAVYKNRRDDVVSFACGWYATTRFVTSEPQATYSITNKYLVGRGATSLTFDEYSALRAYNIVPTSPAEADRLFLQPGGAGNWRKVWDRSVAAMNDSGKAAQAPVDTSGFVAAEVIKAAATKCG